MLKVGAALALHVLAQGLVDEGVVVVAATHPPQNLSRSLCVPVS